jgi:hypothetical protein
MVTKKTDGRGVSIAKVDGIDQIPRPKAKIIKPKVKVIKSPKRKPATTGFAH